MATDLNTNALYQAIQQKQVDANSQADAVKALYTQQPTFQANMQQNLVGEDATLKSSLNNYSDKVAELFAHDKYVSQNYADPNASSFIENPYTRSQASANLYAQKGNEVAGALKTYEGRKAMLGDLVDKALKVYEAGIKGKEMDYSKAKDNLDRTFNLFQIANSNEQNALDRALSRENAAIAKGEKAKAEMESKTQLIDELKNGATLEDVVNGYKDYLDAPTIKQLYNEFSQYGKMKETDSQYNRMYQSAKKGSGAKDLLAALPISQQKPIISGSQSLTAGSDILKAIQTDMGDKAPTFFNAMANKNYGLARKLLQPYLNTGQIGALLDATQAGLRQQIYGSAFTETEAKLAKLWLTQSTDQANQIWVKLLGQQMYGENQIRTAFKARGYSDEEINNYLESIGYSANTQSTTGSNTVQVGKYSVTYQ